MVSVERVLGFSKLKPEAELVKDTDKQMVSSSSPSLSNLNYTGSNSDSHSIDWPTNGSIEVKDLSVRYRSNLPLALKKVNFFIPGGSRVGVVGRTGSGKSTIVQTLFRLLEAENGCIKIDGIDISKLGLHALRTKISVIPQDPTLFSGCTIKENLDLFDLHTDDNICEALANASIVNVINQLPLGWNTLVTGENGSNFSVGQRQLLCLARAILTKNKILVLDEATASVDRRTDELLQEALRSSFEDATILAVAHRLDTVIDSDLIVVLGSGRVMEFGSPAELIRKGGAFASMVQDTGVTMSDDLKRRALE